MDEVEGLSQVEERSRAKGKQGGSNGIGSSSRQGGLKAAGSEAVKVDTEQVTKSPAHHFGCQLLAWPFLTHSMEYWRFSFKGELTNRRVVFVYTLPNC